MRVIALIVSLRAITCVCDTTVALRLAEGSLITDHSVTGPQYATKGSVEGNKAFVSFWEFRYSVLSIPSLCLVDGGDGKEDDE